jgi:hypothetical protein
MFAALYALLLATLAAFKFFLTGRAGEGVTVVYRLCRRLAALGVDLPALADDGAEHRGANN